MTMWLLLLICLNEDLTADVGRYLRLAACGYEDWTEARQGSVAIAEMTASRVDDVATTCQSTLRSGDHRKILYEHNPTSSSNDTVIRAVIPVCRAQTSHSFRTDKM